MPLRFQHDNRWLPSITLNLISLFLSLPTRHHTPLQLNYLLLFTLIIFVFSSFLISYLSRPYLPISSILRYSARPDYLDDVMNSKSKCLRNRSVDLYEPNLVGRVACRVWDFPAGYTSVIRGAINMLRAAGQQVMVDIRWTEWTMVDSSYREGSRAPLELLHSTPKYIDGLRTRPAQGNGALIRYTGIL
jgi:hypothetical protein